MVCEYRADKSVAEHKDGMGCVAKSEDSKGKEPGILCPERKDAEEGNWIVVCCYWRDPDVSVAYRVFL